MPFEGPSDPKLPSNVQGLSLEKRRQFVGAWNGRFEQCREDGGEVQACESSAFAVANAAIKEVAMTTETKPREKRVTQKDCYDMGYVTYGRQATQETAEYQALGGTGTEACANCLFFLSPNRCTVVEDYPLAISPTGISKFWTAVPDRQGEPLRVIVVDEDEEGTSAMSDIGDKQTTKTEDGVQYGASDFAVVPDSDKPSTWKLRLAEGGPGKITVAQVARSITAMQPGGFRGNKVDLSDDDRSQAIGRIGRAINKTGGDDDQKENLRDRLNKIKEKHNVQTAWGFFKALFNLQGDTEKEEPAQPDSNSLQFIKQADGRYRWLATVSNNFRDMDIPPEIFEAKAHKEYIAHLDGGGNYPDLWLWHTPGSKFGKADFADFTDDGFLVMSGTVDEGMEYVATGLSARGDLAVSHGYYFRYSNEKEGLIGWYRTFEVSPLPREMAANPWTGIEIIQKEADMSGFSAQKRQFLVQTLGEEKVRSLESDQAALAKALQDQGVEYKAATEAATPDGNEPAGGGPSAKDLAEAILQTEGFKAMATTLAQVKANSDLVPDLVARVKTLEDKGQKTLEQQVDEVIAAKINGQKGYVASQADDTKVKEDDPVLGAPSAPKSPDGKDDWFGDKVMAGVQMTPGGGPPAG